MTRTLHTIVWISIAAAAIGLLPGIDRSEAPAQSIAAGTKVAKADNAKTPWKSLFNGKTLAGWKQAKFGGEGDVSVEGGAIIMEQGNDMTGVTYAKGDFPKINYEVIVEGKRVKGNDFFCTTTFPVGDSPCSLVVGGWGGGVVGLSSVDDKDASENETGTFYKDFTTERWYRVKIRVTTNRITAWIDDKEVVNLDTKGRKISIRPECDLCRPFGLATWRTVGAVRDIRVRTLAPEELKEKR